MSNKKDRPGKECRGRIPEAAYQGRELREQQAGGWGDAGIGNKATEGWAWQVMKLADSKDWLYQERAVIIARVS